MAQKYVVIMFLFASTKKKTIYFFAKVEIKCFYEKKNTETFVLWWYGISKKTQLRYIIDFISCGWNGYFWKIAFII